MLHFLDKTAASAVSPLYKACMGIFFIHLLIVHCSLFIVNCSLLIAIECLPTVLELNLLFFVV